MNIQNVTRNALKKADRRLVEGVLPYEINKVKPFSMGYLSGFIAEKRDIEQQQLNQEIEQEVKNYAVGNLKKSVSGYRSVTYNKSEARIEKPCWRYALLPVWTVTYRDEKTDKIYYYAFNGQTGKVCGELPVDKKKLAVLFMSIFAPVLAVLLTVGYFL